MKKPLITIASGNPKKVAEIEAMLGPLPIEIQRQPNSLDVEETGKTYFENALLKAKAAAKLTGSWTIADDSGLEVDALGNAPGIFSARLAKTNKEKIDKILTALGDSPYRSAAEALKYRWPATGHVHCRAPHRNSLEPQAAAACVYSIRRCP